MKRDLHPEQTVFMPGCSLRKLAPVLTEDVNFWLQQQGVCTSRYDGCCGEPFELRGKQDRYLAVVEKLSNRFAKQGIKSIVTACPNCYYSLKTSLQALGSDLHMYALPAILNDCGCAIEPPEGFKQARFTIHDSCPDREEAVFGDALRSLMRNIDVVEMEHHKSDSLCCGAGSEFIDLAYEEQLVQAGTRLEEAEVIKAQVVVTACASCTFALCAAESGIPIYHYLNLLFGSWD